MTPSPQPEAEYNESFREPAEARVAAWVVAGLLAVQLLSIWSVRFVPTQDGPVHLEMAAQLRALAGGDAGLLARYYEPNPRPEPNWLVYPLLSALARETSWRVAEKVIFSLYLVALPLALAYALAAARRAAVFLAVFAVPLGANYLFHMGFLNFSLSVPLGLVALGFGLRLRPPRRLGPVFVLALLLLATCAAHVVSACAAIAALCAAAAWREGAASGAGWRVRLRGAVRGLGVPLSASLPTLALVASFLAGPSRHAISWQPPLDLLRRLLFLHVLVSYDRVELVPSVACAALLFGLALLRLAGRHRLAPAARGDELLAAVAVLVALYFVLPASLGGGGYLNPRLQLWAVLLALVWLGGEAWSGQQQRTITVAAGTFGLALILMQGMAYRRLNPYLEEFASIEPWLPADSTVLPLSFVEQEWRLRDASFSGYKVRPFEHALGYLACRKPIVDLTEYQADQGYFPIRYRADVNPYRSLVPEEGVVEDALATIDWQAYEARGGLVDYVLLWGRTASSPWPGEGAFLDRLAADFEPVFSSRPRGLAELYRRRRQAAR